LDKPLFKHKAAKPRLRRATALRMFLPMKTTTRRFITAVTAQGQQPEPANFASGFNKIREDTLRADLTFVASDALQGRMSLQNGDEVASQWIASECHSDPQGSPKTGHIGSAENRP
jgi:hypothetical protein